MSDKKSLPFALVFAVLSAISALPAISEPTVSLPPSGMQVDQPQDWTLSDYRDSIRDAISEQWDKKVPKTDQKTRAMHPAVSFNIARDGSISDLKIDRSCGDAAVDAIMLRCVQDATPFAKPPAGFDGKIATSLDYSDVDYMKYMQVLQRQIKKHWFPPPDKQSERVSVIFKVSRDGTMSGLALDKPSGVKAADDAGLKAVSDVGHFAHLPPGSPKIVDMTFTFDRNVYDGNQRHLVPPKSSTIDSAPRKIRPTGNQNMDAAMLNNEGVRLLNARNFDAAIDSFSKSIAIKPDYQYARENLAICYNNKALYVPPANATGLLHRAVFLQPTNFTTRSNLDQALKNSGKQFKNSADRASFAKECEKQHDYIGAYVEYTIAAELVPDGSSLKSARDAIKDRAEKQLQEQPNPF